MSKKIFFRSILVLVVSYFMLVGVLYENRVSEAGRRPEPPNAACIQGVKNIKFSGRCGQRGRRGFRQANFECYGGSRGELHSRGCNSADTFRSIAVSGCQNMSNCRITPSPTAPACEERPACLDEDPACLIPEPEGGWCVSPPTEELTATPTPAEENLTPTPTICAVPTLPLCEEGSSAIQSDTPNGPGICGFEFVCASHTPTP